MTKDELQKYLRDETKYSRLYLKLIDNAKSKRRILRNKKNSDYEYFEAHHILPKSLFPEFKSFKENSWNKVLLTPREHFICHLLILKHYQEIKYTLGEQKMSRALFKMNLEGRYNSRLYAKTRLNLTVTQETKDKLRALYLGKSLEEIHGVEKAKIIKEKIRNNSPKTKKPWSKERKLKYKNKEILTSRAIKINIYDSYGLLILETNGNFREVCEKNNLPFGSLRNSYNCNGKPILKTKQSQGALRNKEWLKYEGWFAKVV